jgi:hypothetical protein
MDTPRATAPAIKLVTIETSALAGRTLFTAGLIGLLLSAKLRIKKEKSIN